MTTTLIVKDLSLTVELDAEGMTAVRGGHRSLDSGNGPLANMSKSDFKFDAKQMLDQAQNTLVNNGNNSAFVCDVTSDVNPYQNGQNSISFG
jgi:hypothetical protein